MFCDKRIVYNLDGVVWVRCPSGWAISMMGCGGLWDDFPPGYMDKQIERQIRRGVPPDVARRYARAMTFGGCTTAEALEIIRDRDCLGGAAIELWDASDVPTDRWFRDAWRRSSNGGPISVDFEKAKPIQIRHIATAIREENQKRQNELLAPLDIDTDKLRKKVLLARDEKELRSIWID